MEKQYKSFLDQVASRRGREEFSPEALPRSMVASNKLQALAGAGFSVGFSNPCRFSFENTPMHHGSDGAFPGLHTLRID
jgi:hypothetical protein